MTLAAQYSQGQLTHIIEQSMAYSCACPAMVCKQLSALRALYDYQAKCLNQTNTDLAVHESIATHTAEAYSRLELCLTEVLRLEGWEMATLTMPEALQKRLLSEI